MRTRVWLLLGTLVACTQKPTVTDGTPPPETPSGGFEAPVLTNAETPIGYPRRPYEAGVEGTVILRLFVDERGRVLADSTRIAEWSGSAVLDSAALAGVSHFHYAPARRDGVPVATPLLQPVQFRRTDGGVSGDSP
jgi:TonB family protein